MNERGAYEIDHADATQILRAMGQAVLSAPRRDDVVALNKAIVVLADVMGEDVSDREREGARTGEGVRRPSSEPS